MKPAPQEAQIKALVRKAGILFIYAATAVRYIGYDNFCRHPASRLRTILNASQTQGTTKSGEIDQLYATVLGAALGDKSIEPAEREDMQQVLHTVICARAPLTVGALSELLELKDSTRIHAALRPLWSVLHVVGTNELVTTLHASFPDFMFDPARSNLYHCDPNVQHKKIAKLCFKYIKQTQPQFNICNLESSYLLDEQVPKIEERVNRTIPSELLYACQYWVEHMREGNRASDIIEDLRDLLSKRLLLWMEVLNLNKCIETGRETMRLLEEWCKLIVGEQELIELAHDAKRFVDAFASNSVRQSTPHIYVSMLTFWPISTPIAKHYVRFTRGPVEPEGTAMERRQLAHLSTWAFDGAVNAMALSPDGLCIALGMDSSVLVIDSSSGGVVLGPLEGHTEKAQSIAFSPDGSSVIAGFFCDRSKNVTIVGWDTRAGDTVLGPYQLGSHTGTFNCLSFSPDCTCIATGSHGARLWDAKEGSILHDLAVPGLGTLDVGAVTFSPNGTRVAAAYWDTIQVWDSYTGSAILGSLTEMGLMSLITFSPDERHIMGVSDPSVGETLGDIYILDTQSGDQLPNPIDSRESGIRCIGCSSDGKYIVSGSEDRTVRVWDAQNGNMVLGPLNAHRGEITSVAFSPDGSRIISACENGLVCTWDAREHYITPSLAASICWINCAKFSSDGTRFVTGSEDGAICIWDVYTGEMVVGPIQAHTGRITAVDFLNDRVVSGSIDGKICVCDARNGEVVLGPLSVGSTHVRVVPYSLDGQLIDGKICVSDARNGEVVLSPLSVGSTRVRVVTYSLDGKLIATGTDGQVNVWNAENGSRVFGPLTDLDDVGLLRFSPDSTRIVGISEGSGSKITVWDVADGRNVFNAPLYGHSDHVDSVSYSPNGALIASGSRDGSIIVLDAYNGKRALKPCDSTRRICVDFSPDSTRLVSSGCRRPIQIWNVRTGEMVFEIPYEHEGVIDSIAYSPDGTRILSLFDEGLVPVHIYDARSPDER
ncbi:putative vegetative incompatibility protein HET-E-1, partial [Rhizoctonia solani 123E]